MNLSALSSYYIPVVALDRPSKFHISTQLESTAKEILATKAVDRIQAGHFMRTLEAPVNPKLEGYH